MTDPLRELLREARLHVERDAEQWPNDGGPEMLERIDAALAQQPLGTLATNDDPSYSRATNEAQQPEPMAQVCRDCDGVWLDFLGKGDMLPQGTKLYAVDPSAAALIADKRIAEELLSSCLDQVKEQAAEIERLRQCAGGIAPWMIEKERDDLKLKLEAAEHALAQIKEEKAVACPHGVLYPHECRDCQERLGKIELAVIRVCGELRDEAHERRQSDKEAGMFPDEHTAQMLTEWANRLELANTHLLEDIYEQCCEAIKPLVDTGKLPASLVESVQEMAKLYAAPQSPAASNQENAGRKTRQPEETRGLLGASELSGDGHQIDDPQQVGPQPPAGKSQEPQGFNFEAADGEEGD